MRKLLNEISGCTKCASKLPHREPRPVVQAHSKAKLLIVGQAPGLKVHLSGIPWDDASGDRLRTWLGFGKDVFYDPQQVAIVPMGFCYPGKGQSGDLPPRPECFALWHARLLAKMPDIQLTLLVGGYAQAKYLGRRKKSSLTETVKAWREYLPLHLPLPHPSPLNNIWLSKNRWFEQDVVPELNKVCSALFSDVGGDLKRTSLAAELV